jgi:hypothetical protein
MRMVWKESPKRGLWDTVHQRVGDSNPVMQKKFIVLIVSIFKHPIQVLGGDDGLEGIAKERFVGHTTPQGGGF